MAAGRTVTAVTKFATVTPDVAVGTDTKPCKRYNDATDLRSRNKNLATVTNVAIDKRKNNDVTP